MKRSRSLQTFLLMVETRKLRSRSQKDRYHLYHNWSALRPHHAHPGILSHEYRYQSGNADHYHRSNFPTDSDWIPCSYGLNYNYPLVYFPDILDINTVTAE